MSKNGNSYLSSSLYQAAEGYLAQDYSVIPVCGKVAAVRWTVYQRHRATQTELLDWFIQQRHPGLATVTGSISGLIVLDFDDPNRCEQFITCCPDLTATRTIQTRRGWHLWFHIPNHWRISSRKALGVDLKAEGGYVIAPPTRVGNHTYRVSPDQQPHLLSEHDLARIQAFLEALNPVIDPIAAQPGSLSPFSNHRVQPTIKNSFDGFRYTYEQRARWGIVILRFSG